MNQGSEPLKQRKMILVTNLHCFFHSLCLAFQGGIFRDHDGLTLPCTGERAGVVKSDRPCDS